MNDKQKEIEEIAKAIRNIDFPKNHPNVAVANEFEAIIEATALYEQGYRKIPEDSVVLSREEFDEFRKDQAEVKFLKKQITDQARKETAREIFSEIYKLLILIRKQDYEDSVPYYSESVEEFDDKLYELAKRYGVEIGEEV